MSNMPVGPTKIMEYKVVVVPPSKTLEEELNRLAALGYTVKVGSNTTIVVERPV